MQNTEYNIIQKDKWNLNYGQNTYYGDTLYPVITLTIEPILFDGATFNAMSNNTYYQYVVDYSYSKIEKGYKIADENPETIGMLIVKISCIGQFNGVPTSSDNFPDIFPVIEYSSYYCFDTKKVTEYKFYKMNEKDLNAAQPIFENVSDTFNGENWFEFLAGFGRNLLVENSLIDILTYKVGDYTVLSIMFGAGFIIYIGWTITKWAIPT